MTQILTMPQYIVNIVKLVVRDFDGNSNLERLLLGTAAVESGFFYTSQMGRGPAKGFWQMEPTSAVEVVKFIESRAGLTTRFLDRGWMPRGGITLDFLRLQLEYNHYFACSMTRVFYMRFPEPIPNSLLGQAQYWKRYYNTIQGAGTPQKYIQAWDAYGCDKLLEITL